MCPTVLYHCDFDDIDVSSLTEEALVHLKAGGRLMCMRRRFATRSRRISASLEFEKKKVPLRACLRCEQDRIFPMLL